MFITKIYNIKSIKKFLKKYKFILLIIILLLITTFVLIITNSKFQTTLANKLANEINVEFGTEIAIDKATLSYNGKVDLRDFIIRDHKNDTLVFFKNLYLSPISLGKLVSNDLNFSSISFDGLDLKISTYLNENQNSLEIFLEKLNSKNQDSIENINNIGIISNIYAKNSSVKIINYNNEDGNLNISNIDFSLIDFELFDQDFNFIIDNMKLNFDNRIALSNLKGKVNKKDSILSLKNSKLSFGKSNVSGDIKLDYSNINSSDIFSIDFINSAYVNLEIVDSKISSFDLGEMLPNLKTNYDESWLVNTNIKGYLNDLFIENLLLENKNNTINFNSNIKNIFHDNYSLTFDVINFDINSEEIDRVFPKFFGTVLPSSLKTFGRFKMDGYVDFKTDYVSSKFNLIINQGLLKSDLKIFNFSNIDNASYDGTISGFDLDLSSFVNMRNIKKSNFKFEIKGKGFTKEFLNSSVNGKIYDLDFNNYKLLNTDITGNIKDQIFDGSMLVNDDNLSLKFNGLIDFSEVLVDFDFDLNLINADLNKLNFDIDSQISGLANVKLRGSEIENIIGDLSLNNVIFKSQGKSTVFKDFNAQLRYNEDIRIVNIRSVDAFSGILIGEYDFFNLKNTFLNSFGSDYKNYVSDSGTDFQNISFNINFKPKFLSLFDQSIEIDENTFLSGSFNSNGDYELGLKSNSLKYDGLSIEEVDVKMDSDNGRLEIKNIKSNFLEGKELVMESSFLNDTLFVKSNYTSFSNNINKLSFYHTINSENNSVFGFTDLDLILNNMEWSLNKVSNNPSLTINRNSNEFNIKNISFLNKDQSIDLNISNFKKQSKYDVSFKDVELNSFTNKNSSILFDGKINGKLFLNQQDEKFSGESNLIISNLMSNNELIGDASLNLIASEDLKKINIDFFVINDFEKKLNLFGDFSIEENYYPLNLTLTSNDFKISPFSNLIKNSISNFEGEFNSEIKITGNSSNPVFYGNIVTSNVAFKVPYLNVRYEIEDNSTFFLNDQSFFIDDFVLTNRLTNTFGNISGKISHNLFKNWFLELDINSKNLMILNTQFNDNSLYYGTGMFNGNAIIYGPEENILINLKGSTNKNTSLVIPIKDSNNVGDFKFLNYINPNSEQSEFEKTAKSLLVELDIDFNSNANLEVILDSESQSRINGFGNGRLNFKINTLGNFNMFGNFDVEKGSYFYKSLGIVNREFNILKGSRIVWNGDPYLGDLNINAKYEVPGGANPAILIQNTSFNRKIPTNVNVVLAGNFNEMETPDFEIEFPNTSGPIKSELDYYLVDKEKKQKQALSLLYQSTFIDEVSLSTVSSQAITNNLFQSASGLIDNIFANSDDKMNIGVNYLKGDKNASSSLLNRDRLGLTLKTEISDKILINGKIGVPVGGIEENVVIGDVQIEFLLNDEGNLKARFFNKENEYQYFGNDIGYTQGMGISYEIDFNDIKNLFRKNKDSKSRKKSN